MKKRYAKGTDTVDAKLTPREAVLNRNAAELLGRDAISRLNAHGNMLAKRGVDLASLPSDPTPGPSTENMLGYQMGTYDVGRDDRGDLMRDAENTFYGGGQAPMPTPTPTPIPQKYQYGTEDVRRRRNAASRLNFPQGQIIQGSGSGSGGYGIGRGALSPDQNPAYQAAIAKGRPAASAYTWITTPSGGQMKVPTASIGNLTRKGSALEGSTFSNVPAGFGRPNTQASYALGNTGAVPTGNTPYEKSYRMGYEGGAVQQPQPTLGYQIGSAIGNFSPVNFGQGLVNAASRIGQGIANVFTGGNAQAAPTGGPQPSPTPFQTPNPVATPTPTPTIPPDQNPYGFQYGTASVPSPRRYSDYY